jgi:hypothetical protein
MQIGILGTGGVGRTLAGALASGGHDVVLGSRDPDAALAREEPNQQTGTTLAGWHADHPQVGIAPFAGAAEHGEVVMNATSGSGALAAVDAAGAGPDGKILIDVTNPLAWSERGVSLIVANTDSLAEQIQRAHPEVRVVKALNTVTAALMVDPGSLHGGDHSLPICGNDTAAKVQVTEWLRAWFGWTDVIDLGDLAGARSMEAYILLWLRLYEASGTTLFNTKVVR